MQEKPIVLVADDQPVNVKLLQRKLERHGIEVLTASNGIECLEVVKQRPPDLILLDVMMPEMDGITTCQQLKANPATETIPVIFITARASKEGKIEGLDAGAADYITKPIDLDETLARVRTQLRMGEMYRENLELQQRLADARKAASIGAVTQGIAHNLNNLLGVVVGYLDLLKKGHDSPDRLERAIRLMDNAVQRMVLIVRELSTMANKDSLELKDVKVHDLLTTTVSRFRKEHNILSTINWVDEVPDEILIRANVEVLEAIIGKILINAWEAYPKETAPKARIIDLTSKVQKIRGESFIAIIIRDHGVGLPAELGDSIFDPFVTSKTAVGRGMGLTTARHDLRNLGGDIILENAPGGGARATIKYPF